MATIRDVAKRANVAVSTVSAVINQSAPVSQAVVARVEAAVREMGYTPNVAARNLRRGDSRLIGLVVPDISNPYFSTIARIVEARSLAAGYMAFVYNSDEDPRREEEILRMMQMQRIAGLILTPAASSAEHGRRLARHLKVPTILLDRHVEDVDYEAVLLDNRQAARLAADYLLRLGHRRIAIIAGREGVSSAEERLEGCRDAFAKHGVPLDPKLMLRGDYDQTRAMTATQRLMSGAERVTAVLAFNNVMTIGILRGLHSLGLSCPGDVSIIGIDDFDWAEAVQPRLTVVAQPVAAMAERAIGRLLARLGGEEPSPGEWHVFEPVLVARDSCIKFDGPGPTPPIAAPKERTPVSRRKRAGA
ncbi:MAG: LacI family DNA-binding transcriptional regulator [Rhizobiaceae bacterium]|nr:LacI family DNA-binding transcriptional regulator [Rhizobiaceae bacterium]